MTRGFVESVRWLIRGHTGTAAAIQTTIAQVLIVLINVATGVITARTLAPQGRGELAAISVVPMMLASLMGFGIPAALTYHLKRHTRDVRSIIGAAIVMNLGISLLAVLVGELVIPLALRQYGPGVVLIARWFVLWAPMSLFFYVCSSIYEAHGDFLNSNASRFVSPLLTFALLIGLLLTHHLTVLTASLSYAFPSLPTAAKMLTDVWRRNRPTFARTLEPYRRLMNFGLQSYGIDVLRSIGMQINQLLVVGFLSPATMGLYVVALSIASMLQVIQSSISRVLLPKVSARPLPEVIVQVGRAARISGAVTSLLAAGLVLFGPLLLHLLYGPRFVGGSVLLRLLAAEAVFSSTTSVLIQTFSAQGRPGIVTLLQAAGLALSVPLLFLLIPRFGLVGAGIALLVATVARFALALACYPLLLHVRAPRVIPTRADFGDLLKRLRYRGPEHSKAPA